MQEYRERVVRVGDVFGLLIAEYSNGYETTAGFIETLEDSDCRSITYDSEHCTELPVRWAEMPVLDDNDKRQMIKEIRFSEVPAYVMEDGSFSYTVTTLY